MRSLCHFLGNNLCSAQLNKRHILGQINISSADILLVNRANHTFIAEHKLGFALTCDFIVGVVERKRSENHFVFLARLAESAVEIRNQAVTHLDNILEIFAVFKIAALLIPCSESGVVTHKRCENSESKETQNEVTCCVLVKTAQICTAVEETAHICRRKHFEIEKNMRPPRMIVTEPDTA